MNPTHTDLCPDTAENLALVMRTLAERAKRLGLRPAVIDQCEAVEFALLTADPKIIADTFEAELKNETKGMQK